MKKIISSIVLIILAISLFGCGSDTLSFSSYNIDLKVGDEFTLEPLTEEDAKVLYAVDIQGIIEISENKIKALKEGEVKITASLEKNEDVTAVITVKVAKVPAVIEAIVVVESPVRINIADFVLEDYNLEVSYSDSTNIQIPLDIDMITIEDYELLSVTGSREITVSYEGLTTTFVLDLSPNAKPKDYFEKGIVLYQETTKVGEDYVATFYAIGDTGCASFQIAFVFQQGLNIKSAQTAEGIKGSFKYNVIDQNIYLTYAGSSNIELGSPVFSITFTADSQYEAFREISTFNDAYYTIIDDEVVEVKSGQTYLNN